MNLCGWRPLILSEQYGRLVLLKPVMEPCPGDRQTREGG
jgi:hypothetical protein